MPAEHSMFYRACTQFYGVPTQDTFGRIPSVILWTIADHQYPAGNFPDFFERDGIFSVPDAWTSNDWKCSTIARHIETPVVVIYKDPVVATSPERPGYSAGLNVPQPVYVLPPAYQFEIIQSDAIFLLRVQPFFAGL